MHVPTPRFLALVAFIAAAPLAGALAAGDPIAERRALMRDNAKAERIANSSILGKFMPEKVAAAMAKVKANMAVFVTLFPPGTESGGETHAGTQVWTDRVGFETTAAQLVIEVSAAEEAARAGQDTFAIAWATVAATCNGCHATYAPDLRQ